MLANSKKTMVGDCEVCDATNIEIFMGKGNIKMCATHYAQELEVVKANQARVSNLVEDLRKVDSSLQIRTDIHNAQTIPIVELRASIMQDENIPESEKEFVFATECKAHVLKLREVAFSLRQQLLETENAIGAWQTNGQVAVGKLRSDIRAHFRELDFNYQPGPITKKVKTTKPVKSGKAFDKAELYAAARKYDVPAAQVQGIKAAQNLSYEDAAKRLAEMLGKL